MPANDPGSDLKPQILASRPVLPAALRARALAAGHAAWTPWWRRLSTWSVAAAAVLACDLALLSATAPTPPPAVPPVAIRPVIEDDPLLREFLARQRNLAVRPTSTAPNLHALASQQRDLLATMESL